MHASCEVAKGAGETLPRLRRFGNTVPLLVVHAVLEISLMSAWSIDELLQSGAITRRRASPSD